MTTPRYIAARPSVLLAALGACALILAFALAAYAVQAQGQDVTTDAAATGDSPPGQPGRPQATVVTHDYVTITWAESSDDTVTHYAVLRRNRDTDAGGVFHVIQANAGLELSYTDSTVAAESSYVYRVKAVSPTGVSRWSGYVNADTPAAPEPTPTPEPTPAATPEPTAEPTPTATPEPTATPTPEPETTEVTPTKDATGDNPPARPTGLEFSSASYNAVNIFWVASSDETVTHYAVLRRNPDTDAPGVFLVIEADAGPETSYTDSTVAADSWYVYRVKAVSPGGVSQWSSYDTAYTPAAPQPTPTPDPAALAPSGLSAVDTAGGVLLTWDAPEEDAESVTGYEVLRAQGEADLTTLAEDTGSADTSYTDATATEQGETYAYGVMALRGEEKSQASNRTAAFIPKITREGEPPTSAARSAATRREIWSARLTAAAHPSFEGSVGLHGASGSISDSRFTVGSTTFVVTFFRTNSQSVLQLHLDDPLSQAQTDSYILDVDGTELLFSAASYSENTSTQLHVYAWPGISWSVGQVIDVAITEAVNVAATGKPSITGNPYVGQRVTADTSDIADANGIAAGAFSYRWVSNDGTTDTNIANATRQSYVLTASEQGKNIKVVVSFNDEDGYDETVTSDAKAVPVTSQEIWSATLTVGQHPTSEIHLGYVSGEYGTLSDNTVAFGSTTYTIEFMEWRSDSGTLRLKFDRNLPQLLIKRWTLVIDDETVYPFEGRGANVIAGKRMLWTLGGLSWSDGQTVALAIQEDVNVEAAGRPAITGTQRVGEALTADTSAIADANGIPGGAFRYQWVSNDGTNDTDIPGATQRSYSLTESDEGRTIKVKVTFNDGDGFKETVTSDATAAVGERVVEIWSARLTAKPGSSNANSLGFGPANTGSVLSDDDFTHGSTTYTIQILTSTRFFSQANYFKIYILFDREPTPGQVEVWTLNIGGREHSFKTAGTSISGKAFDWERLYASFSDGQTTDVSIAVTNTASTGQPVIDGRQRVGGTLTADTSAIADADGLPEDVAYSYQWVSNDGASDADIPDANGPSYVLTEDEEGKTVKVRVAFTDSLGFSETVSSDATAAVGERAIEIWAAKLTAGSAGQGLGYKGTGASSGGNLSDTDFIQGSTPYTVQELHTEETHSGPTTLTLQFDAGLTTGQVETWILEIAGKEFPLAGRIVAGQKRFFWPDTGLSWSDGQMIDVAIIAINVAATGKPVIGGTLREGGTLTADTSAIMDPNAVPDDVVYTYQWVAASADGKSETNIEDATGPTYTLTGEEPTGNIMVRVGFTDSLGFSESQASDIVLWQRSDEIWAATLTVGQSGGLLGYGVGYSGANLSDAEFTLGNRTYRVLTVIRQSADNSIRIGVARDTRSGGISPLVSIGTATTDAWTLRLDDREYSFENSTSPSARRYQWTELDLSWAKGDKVRMAISVSNTAATGKPVIGGRLRVGETLTANTSAIADANGIPGGAFTYQWVSNDGTSDADIPGATGSTYTLTPSDLGKTIKVRVAFSDGHGYAESVTSDATAAVKVRAVEIWSAKLTAGSIVTNELGYNGESTTTGGELTDPDFTQGSTTYTIEALYLDTSASNPNLNLRFDQALTTGQIGTWMLEIAGTEFPIARTGFGGRLYLWVLSGLSWSNGQMIDVSILAINGAATGQPAVTGTPRVGETLTADTSGIDDPNSIPGGAFTYQWLRVNGTADTDIPGATGPTYIPTPPDLGKTVKVRVAFDDGHGFEEAVISEATEAVVQSYGNVILSAKLTVGVSGSNVGFATGSSGSHGELEPNQTSFGLVQHLEYRADTLSFNHQGSPEQIAGGDLGALTQGDYILFLDGVPFLFEASGNVITFGFPNHGLRWIQGQKVEVRLSQNRPATGAPAITGTAQVTRTLAVDLSGITDADGIPGEESFSYKWTSSDDGSAYTDIAGATGATYTLETADEGRTIQVEVGFTDNVGYQEGPLTSSPSGNIAEAPPVNSAAMGQPTVGGTLEVSRLLTADASGITDQNGIPAGAFRYQWLRVNGTIDDDIPGASGSTYRLAAADLGKTIKVKVSFTDGDGYPESRTSAATGRIGAATNSPATGGPAIIGKPELGVTLRADTTGIMDENGVPGDVSYTYQWLRLDGDVETEIAGETGASYELTEADPGKRIKVRATFTDLGGFTESPISDPTGAVSESTLVTEEGYAPRRLYHIDAPVVEDGELIEREAYLHWINPQRVPLDDPELSGFDRYEVQSRTQPNGQGWGEWEDVAVPDQVERTGAWNKLEVEWTPNCQNRDFRVRALYDEPSRHSSWVFAGSYKRTPDGPPGTPVPLRWVENGSWVRATDDGYELGFGWRPWRFKCHYITGWETQRRYYLAKYQGVGDPDVGEELWSSGDGNLVWDPDTMTLDGKWVWTKWENGDTVLDGESRSLTYEFQDKDKDGDGVEDKLNYQYRVRARNDHGSSPWSKPMMFSVNVFPSGGYFVWLDREE